MNVWIGEGQGEFVEYISIPFTREEWHTILSDIEYTVHYSQVYPDECEIEYNIIDRIRRNLGIE